MAPAVKTDTGLLLRRISRGSRSEKRREDGVQAVFSLCEEGHPVSIGEAVALVSESGNVTYQMFDLVADGFARWQAFQSEKSA